MNKKLTDYLYYETELGKLYCGDCLEIMQNLSLIDLTITSPPFNLGNDHHTGSKRHEVYFDSMPENKYQDWQIKILNKIFGITVETGSIFYNHKNRIRNGLLIIPYVWIFKSKWLIKQEVVWWNGGHNFDNIRFYPQTERIYWLCKTRKTKLKNPISLLDIWHISPVGSKEEHTRQYPLKLVENIVCCFEKNKIVFDPFLGSGTTALVCEKLNRRWIGIEISEQYCEIAKKRIETEAMQIKMSL